MDEKRHSSRQRQLKAANAVFNHGHFTRRDLFKVWFNKDGVLYEIQTFNEDEALLLEVLKAWQFI